MHPVRVQWLVSERRGDQTATRPHRLADVLRGGQVIVILSFDVSVGLNVPLHEITWSCVGSVSFQGKCSTFQSISYFTFFILCGLSSFSSRNLGRNGFSVISYGVYAESLQCSGSNTYVWQFCSAVLENMCYVQIDVMRIAVQQR